MRSPAQTERYIEDKATAGLGVLSFRNSSFVRVVVLGQSGSCLSRCMDDHGHVYDTPAECVERLGSHISLSSSRLSDMVEQLACIQRLGIDTRAFPDYWAPGSIERPACIHRLNNWPPPRTYRMGNWN
ncbi:Uncharacterized protein HZ326_4579 [Fusarium oxysporum f. sp. albedinis]|nr:Uncharacterized protein HZ326_4579 [Fusarium oxysporum f. sp. albedinis]